MSHEKDLERKEIFDVDIHNLFFEISELCGYPTSYVLEHYQGCVERLVYEWSRQGYIEIYQYDKDRQYKRIKPSDSAQNSVPWYIGVYHARLIEGENDPLVTIVFEDTEIDGEQVVIASMRFILDHDYMFGGPKDKHDPAKMKAIRQRVDELIQKGNRCISK